MNELAGRLEGHLLGVTDADAVEFEARLADSSALAVRVAYSVVRNQHDAEDVAQEAFARAYRRFAALRDRERFRAWLVRMTWRIALDHRRAQKRRLVREDVAGNEVQLVGDFEQDTLAKERSTRLWQAIDELPERLRVVTVLAAIEGHGMKEVSALLGVAEGTVKSRLFEARQQLHEKLR